MPVLSSTTAVDAAGGLERLAVADQDAQLGGLAGADHDRGRRGQAEGAGAGDDQDRDGRADREHQPVGLRPEGQPAEERDQRGQQHGRHEPRGHPVGQPLHRGGGALRVLDEPHDLGERAVGADRGGADDEGAGAC